MLFSAYGMGLDNLLYFYEFANNPAEAQLRADFSLFLDENDIDLPVSPYFVQGSQELLSGLARKDFRGVTITAPGFYAPQGRQLRAPSAISKEFLQKLAKFRSDSVRITNFEMETSAIYGLSRILKHHALSCNIVLANRARNTFSQDPASAIDRMISTVLERMSEF